MINFDSFVRTLHAFGVSAKIKPKCVGIIYARPSTVICKADARGIIEHYWKDISKNVETSIDRMTSLIFQKKNAVEIKAILQEENPRALMASKSVDQLKRFLKSDFHADGSEIWMEFVEVFSRNNLGEIIDNFYKFKIRDQNFCYSFIKKNFEFMGVGYLLYHFPVFGLTDEKLVFDLLMLCASDDGLQTAKNFVASGIKMDEQSLIKVAVECLKQDKLHRHEIIHLFLDLIKEQRAAFALECSKICVVDLLNVIDRFKINDENALREIAFNCAIKEPLDTAYNLKYFRIKDEDILADIAYMCMKHCSPAKAQFLERIFIEKGVSAKVLLKKVNSESVFNIECNIKSLDKITNPHAQMQTIFWLCNAITLLQKMSPSQQNWIDNHQFLLHIQKVDDPVLRTNLLMCLNELISRQLNFEKFEGIKVNVSSNKGKKLESSLYLIELMLAFIKSNKVTVDLIKQNSRFFVSDTYKLNVFLRAFSKIVMDAFLNEAALTCIAKNLFEKPELMLKRLSFVSVIYDFKEQARFRYHRGTIESVLKVILQEKLTNFIEVDERTADKLQMVFGASRNPEALYIYVSNLSTLGDSSLNNAVKEFLRAVVDDRFQEYRYDISKNTHLNQINGYDADLLEKWKANSQCMFGGADSKEKIDFQEWFKQKLMVDGHYPKEKMKALWAFLNKQKCDEPLDDMQRLCIELIKDPENDVTVKLMQLQKLVKNTEFENDVSALLIKPRKISEDAVVVNTDDPVDFLLCGTDIKSSCQRVDGNAKHNKGLLGYLLNGQTRLLAVKTKAGAGGAIQARCLLRLLWDEKRKVPVLFRERFYGVDAKEALNKLAISKAEEMGLDLLSLDEGDVHYENPIMSLGGRAPYEYVDASEDGMKHSEYTIYAARLIKKGKKRRREEG